MNANLILARRVAIGCTFALALAGCASGPASTPLEIAQRIEAANTRADHESLASYYLVEAAKARTAASTHLKMAKSYQFQAVSGRSGASMPVHCHSLVQSYEGIAKGYDAMAASHREMAALARP